MIAYRATPQKKAAVSGQAPHLPWLPAPVPGPSYAAFAEQDETPPPPPMFFARRLTRHPHGGGWCMALGSLEGEPVVLSGHDEGDLDVFALTSGLPLPSLGSGTSRLTVPRRVPTAKPRVGPSWWAVLDLNQ